MTSTYVGFIGTAIGDSTDHVPVAISTILSAGLKSNPRPVDGPSNAKVAMAVSSGAHAISVR
jgi:hypothetical protein